MRLLTGLVHRLRSRGAADSSDERGFILVWYALLIFVMLGVTAFAVDLGHAYLVGQEEQNAADAAALSAASFLPDNCVNANSHALTIATTNGFTNGSANTNVTAVNGSPGGPGCDADPTLKTNEIRVNVKRKVDTWFARAIGIDTLTVSRTSVAEYDPPVALGSPTNYFGNIVGCATCNQPDIWASVVGRANRKNDGNAIYSGWCVSGATSADNCPPTDLNNQDRDTNGMLLQIKNPQLEPLNLEIYDPGFIGDGNGQTCASGAPYPICTGDTSVLVKQGNPPPLQTTYTLYPLDNLTNPLGSPPICSVTYPGYNSAPAGVDDVTTRSFHRWANFATDASLSGGCPALTGSSYVLQIQSGDGRGLPTEAGVNNFSVAACGACSQNQPTVDPNVSVSAITKMSLFANSPASNPKFYLARVPTWARGQFLTLTFFDIGDIGPTGQAVPGALTVSAVDATHGSNGGLVGEFSGCTYSHPDARNYINDKTTPWDPGANPRDWADDGNLTTVPGNMCTAPVTVSGGVANWNGKWVSWQVKIPDDYTCNDLDQTKCWLQIQYAYPTAQFHDATTWTAVLSGNPVRLTK